MLFRTFERLIAPTRTPDRPEPPPGLMAFYWHFVQQARGLFIGLLGIGLVVALLDAMIPIFMGRLVKLVSEHADAALLREAWPTLAGMAAIAAGRASARHPHARPDRQPGDRARLLQPDPLAERIGMSCANPGPSSRTISPAASPTASCRPARRCARRS